MKSTVHNSFSEFIIIVHHEILRRFLYFCVADNTEIKPKKKKLPYWQNNFLEKSILKEMVETILRGFKSPIKTSRLF